MPEIGVPIAAVTVAGLMLLAGCLQAPVFTVDVSTHYDPDLSADGGRDHAERNDIDAGDPAANASLKVTVGGGILDPPPSPTNRSRGDVLEPRAGHPYRIPLDASGRTTFRVRTDEPQSLHMLVTDYSPGDSCWTVSRVTDDPPSDTHPPVEDDLTLDIPFGFDCGG